MSLPSPLPHWRSLRPSSARRHSAAAVVCGMLCVIGSSSIAQDASGQLKWTQLYFTEDNGKPHNETAITLTPRLHVAGDSGFSMLLQPILTWTKDTDKAVYINPNRSFLRYASGSFDATVGSDIVFWGVSEGAQLSNVINQRDLVSDFRGDEKIGRLMFRLGWGNSTMRFDAFYMPNTDARRFRNPPLRLGGLPAYDTDNTIWPTSNETQEDAIAARASASLGNFELGVYAYQGINNDPSYLPGPNGPLPIYAETTQIGVDLQWTYADLIVKYEGRYDRAAPTRFGNFERENAHLIGAEYTVYNLFQSDANLTSVLEYSRSSIRKSALHPYQDDLLFGLRAELNNLASTELTFAYRHDFTYGSNIFEAGVQTRLTDSVSLDLTYVNTSDMGPDDPYAGLTQDSHIAFNLIASF